MLLNKFIFHYGLFSDLFVLSDIFKGFTSLGLETAVKIKESQRFGRYRLLKRDRGPQLAMGYSR